MQQRTVRPIPALSGPRRFHLGEHVTKPSFNPPSRPALQTLQDPARRARYDATCGLEVARGFVQVNEIVAVADMEVGELEEGGAPAALWPCRCGGLYVLPMPWRGCERSGGGGRPPRCAGHGAGGEGESDQAGATSAAEDGEDLDGLLQCNSCSLYIRVQSEA